MTEQKLRNVIDDYSTSIHAIVGFANFYLWDDSTRADRSGVVVFQGRRLHPPASSPDSAAGHSEAYVTPDLGVLLPDRKGVLAEVKMSFPKDQSLWMDDFEQLMAYDVDLTGWPSQDGLVDQHDVVLIIEQGRAVRVRKFYESHADSITFTRPFIMVQINRSDNRQPYYFFQRVFGTLSDANLDTVLEEGKKVPMKVFLEKYSTVKLYDAEPPVPYLMELIWTHVVVDAARLTPGFGKLRKRQKLPVDLKVEEIVQRLREGFSFRSIDAHATDGSPSFPKKAWVVNALEQYVSAKLAEWIDAQKDAVRFQFQRLEDPLGEFIAGFCRTKDAAREPVDQQKPLPFPDD